MRSPFHSALTSICLSVWACAEVALVGWWLTTGSPVGFIVFQMLLLFVVATILLVVRYVGFRRQYEQALANNAVLAERNRLSEDMHDVLGHDLSVIALRAAALQMRTTADAREAAAEIRRDAERAVDRLHETLIVLRTDAPEGTGNVVSESTESLIARVRTSGTAVTLAGALPADLADPVERGAYRVIRETLTNAIRHAPGQPISVTVGEDINGIVVAVHNPIAATHAKRPEQTDASSGLAALRRRVSALGGTLTIHREPDSFVVLAHLPHHPPSTERAQSFSSVHPRRPLRATLVSAAIPFLAIVALVVGFYTWSVHDVALDDQSFDRITSGMPAAVATPQLPARQAPVRLVPTAPHDPDWDCAYYSDGNFPLGLAVFEVCFHNGVVVAANDLRQKAWL
jgi:signal transduction histidine kinase